MTLAGCARLHDITLDLLYADPMFHATRVDGERATDRTLRVHEVAAPA